MSGQSAPVGDQETAFLAFYDDALPSVYGYLSTRCRPQALAEDLTAETFLAAVDAYRWGDPPPMTVPWLIGVARHKLVDHGRRQARQERGLQVLAAQDAPPPEDLCEARLDAMHARQALDQLAPQYRAALTLRYLDDLPVPDVAALLGRTLTATEALLVRAKAAFRRVYRGEESWDD